MRILGIDPGIAIVGWGVIDYDGRNLKPVDFGAITTTPDQKTEDRITAVYRELSAIIAKYAPDAMAGVRYAERLLAEGVFA